MTPDNGTKRKVRIGDIKKRSCCAVPDGPVGGTREASCCPPADAGSSNPAHKSTVPDWDFKDHLGRIRCRLGSYRMRYIVSPGLYSIGNPGRDSDVFVTANYKLSFDVLRRALKGFDAWILVLDTKGINVWCAAGKGTFGTDELVRMITVSGLAGIVSHRRIIVPQLAAPGVAAHEVRDRTGFKVFFGPVDAKDIPAYVKAGYMVAGGMRRVRFGIIDRIVLTPMELVPALKAYPVFALIVLAAFGARPTGIYFNDAVKGGLPFLLLGLVSILSGALLTPALLPFIPFRSFAVKGWITGALSVFLALNLIPLLSIKDAWLLASAYIFFPLASSFIALQFTGSTVFTGKSGVKKELRYAIPAYISGALASIAMLVISLVSGKGVS